MGVAAIRQRGGAASLQVMAADAVGCVKRLCSLALKMKVAVHK